MTAENPNGAERFAEDMQRRYGDAWPAHAKFQLDLLRDAERVRKQRGILERTIDRLNDEIESILQISAKFGLEQLPTADAPPLVVSIMRAELARAFVHLRYAGRCANRLGLDVSPIADAVRALRSAVSAMPNDLPRETVRRNHDANPRRSAGKGHHNVHAVPHTDRVPAVDQQSDKKA